MHIYIPLTLEVVSYDNSTLFPCLTSGEGRQFQIVVILKMTLHQYGIRASEVRDMVDGLMTDSGLTVVNITPSEYSEEE